MNAIRGVRWCVHKVVKKGVEGSGEGESPQEREGAYKSAGGKRHVGAGQGMSATSRSIRGKKAQKIKKEKDEKIKFLLLIQFK